MRCIFKKTIWESVSKSSYQKTHQDEINSLQRPKIMGDEESTLGGYHEYRGGQYFWIIGNPLM